MADGDLLILSMRVSTVTEAIDVRPGEAVSDVAMKRWLIALVSG